MAECIDTCVCRHIHMIAHTELIYIQEKISYKHIYLWEENCGGGEELILPLIIRPAGYLDFYKYILILNLREKIKPFIYLGS